MTGATATTAERIASAVPDWQNGAARRQGSASLRHLAEDRVPIARYLRVVTFASDGHESSVDAALRDVCLPALLDHPCVVDAWIGRHGARLDQRRVIASTWTEMPGESAPDADVLDRVAASVGSPLPTEDAQTLQLAVHNRFDRPEPARILRVFRGRVKLGELDAYVDEARSGMLADAMVNDGLVAFALGADPPEAFVTVSAWTGWPAIEEATGGNTRRPIATRNRVRLAGFDVVHFELLPDAADHRPEAATGRS